MKYRQKAVTLAALAVVLALVYVLSFVFDPARGKSAAFAWLPPSMLNLVDRIEITGSGGLAGDPASGLVGSPADAGIILSRKNNIWFFNAGAMEYPVRQSRVRDLLAVLSRKEAYALRAVSAEGRERLGFGSGTARNAPGGISSRILVRGGEGLPLLDLHVGALDALGREVYLKRADKNDIYSGEDFFSSYTESMPGFWYDLRLFRADTAVASVQQAEIILPLSPQGDSPQVDPSQGDSPHLGFAPGGDDAIDTGEIPGRTRSFILRRSGGGWVMPGSANAEMDAAKVDAWIRSVLEAEAADFGSAAPGAIDGSITLALGDGSSLSIQVGPAGEENRRSAMVSNSPLVYILPQWTISRLWRESGYFLAGE